MTQINVVPSHMTCVSFCQTILQESYFIIHVFILLTHEYIDMYYNVSHFVHTYVH